MPIVIIVIVALISCLIVFSVIRRKKAVKILEGNIEDFNKQIIIFNSEYAEIRKHCIPESEENDFVEKWHDLYSNVTKYYFDKNNEYVEIQKFKETYKNLHKSFSDSNTEIDILRIVHHRIFRQCVIDKQIHRKSRLIGIRGVVIILAVHRPTAFIINVTGNLRDIEIAVEQLPFVIELPIGLSDRPVDGLLVKVAITPVVLASHQRQRTYQC